MFKKILLIFTLTIFSTVLKAQDWTEIYYLENEAHYLVSEFQFEKAIDNFKRILRDVPNHSLIKYHIGKTYLLTDDQKEKAVEFLEEAAQDAAKDFDGKSIQETRAPIDAHLYLGQAYQYVGRLEDAENAYTTLKSLISPDDELYPKVIHGLKTCENATKAMKNPVSIIKTNQGNLINDINSNINPVISGDGNTMVFTTIKRDDIDLHISTKQNNVWSTPKRITNQVSPKYYLVSVSLSYNGDQLYLATNDKDRNDVFVSYREGKNWTAAEKLDKTINGKKSNETHAVVTKDGNTIYFTSDMEGGLGGFDIYKSTKDEKGKWDDPVNLGPAINTKFNEATPFLTLDDKYLFFSSEGHTSMGGYDIFYIDLDSKDQAINLGYPINTTGNDLFFVPDNSLNTGYISKFDDSSVGKNDIYKLSIIPKINLAGKIQNSENEEPVTEENLSLTLLGLDNKDFAETTSSSNGTFHFELTPGKYILTVVSENYEADTSEITIPSDYSSSDYYFTAQLNPLKQEEELVADLVEVPVEEAVVEETVVQVADAEEPIQEEVEHEPELAEVVKPVEEEIQVEQETVEQIDKPVIEPEPKKEVEKYVPVSTSSASRTEKTYSVQLMALKTPVDISYFKNVEGVQQKLYEDGYYRYTVGNTKTYTEAVELKKKINAAGYKDVFIRENNIVPKYTIQLMALLIPVETTHFENITSVVVTKGADDYYRYTVGDFTDYNEAKQELSKIAELGYENAFVKRSN